MEQNDRKPAEQEAERRPVSRSAPEGGTPSAREGDSHRRKRNRHRNRHHRENAVKEPVSETSPQETETPRQEGESGSPNNSGEPKKRRRNRNRRRNHRDTAEQWALTSEDDALLADSDAEAAPDEEPIVCPAEELSAPSVMGNTPSAPKEARESPQPVAPLYTVTGIRFRPDGKIYYFDPGAFTCVEHAHVIVETARGLEFGIVALGNRQVSGKDVVLPLRRVVRFATEEDERHHEENLEKETEAFNLCLSRIEAHHLEMKLVDVEYAFDNSKLLFYFTSEERVDFRELVKDLASVFRTRIELRQIGIRDEAKLMGGLGTCGRPFCCKSFLPDFVQVSIKMAKEQNLSLNSSKISGACGRLMCCLRYEYDTYVEESAITPKVDAIVDTPDGEGIVTESSPLKGIVKVTLNKEPNTSHIYRREDVVVKGHAKKRKNNENEGKKAEEKK